MKLTEEEMKKYHKQLPAVSHGKIHHGTYPLNLMGHNVIDGKFACPMIEGNHHETNQSEMHQI